MRNITLDCTQEEFEKMEILHIKFENCSPVIYIREDFMLASIKRWTQKLVNEGLVTIVPGKEDFFNGLNEEIPEGAIKIALDEVNSEIKVEEV